MTTEGIQSCQSKAMLFPATWEADINSSVGSATITQLFKVVIKEVYNKLCDLMSAVKLTAQESPLDTSTPKGSVSKDTFVTEDNDISD